MGSLPIISNVFRCVLEYHSTEATYANVMHFESAGSSVVTDVLSNLHDATLNGGGTSRLQALFSSQIALDKWVCTPLDGVTPTAEQAFTSIAGTGTSPASAANAAGIITLKTATRGRSYRGRIYLGGLPQGLLDDTGAQWKSSWVSDANLWFGNFLAHLAADTEGLQQVVASYKHGTAALVGDWVPRQYVGTIRRRTERVATP